MAAGIPLVKRVILTALDQNGWSLRDFDLNGPDRKPDGYADGIILILNVGWFGVALPFGLIDSRFIVEQDGVKATLAAIASGPRALGMSLHEFGHLLGFADLYDEWGMTYGLGMSLMGRWDYDLRTTPLLDAFSRVMIGWARLERITGQREVWLAPVLSSGRVIQLGGGDEFFLVENRSPIPPFDGGLKRSGLAIYQVNLERLPDREGFDFIRTVLDCPNCRPFRPLVMNVQADGRFDLQVRTHPFEAEEDLFHTGDALLPRPEGPPLSRSNLLLSTNQSNGKPTQTMVVQIDSDSYQPMIRATFAAPFPRNPCDRLQRPPDPSCLEGARRPPLESDFGPPPGPPRAALPALAASAPGCFSLGEYLDWRILSIILLILWLILRPLLKRRYEERLRKQGLLKKDENVKGRFEK